MKKLSEMKLATEAILTEMETAVKGERPVGNGTEYYGPSNPSSITTYVDGMNWGEDGSSGSIFGDSYSIHRHYEPDFFNNVKPEGEGKMLVEKRREK
ncbi:hypothetical protein [Tenacibaculum sp. nBUS_03]|uniref:hypothetical protein n=1 Tax=Tenacibaculum sp. nBUS_03 TaxID=3395320 RepID=UPI003EB85D71